MAAEDNHAGRGSPIGVGAEGPFTGTAHHERDAWTLEHDHGHASLHELALRLSAEGEVASVRGFFHGAVAVLRC